MCIRDRLRHDLGYFTEFLRAHVPYVPKLVEPLLGIARTERALGNDAAARRALRKAEKLRPDDAQVRSLLEGS